MICKLRRLAVLASLLGSIVLPAWLSGCGGSSGSIGLAVLSLGGTAAFGAPIAGATVTVKDLNGVTRTATTGADGRYSISVEGLTPPFLVRVEPAAAQAATVPALFSFAPDAGTANVDPYTNLVVDTYYDVQGATPTSTIFANAVTGTARPSDAQYAILQELVERLIAQWLQRNQVDAAAFDIGQTPYSANGTGYDRVLDLSTITGTSVVISDGTTTQSSTVTAATTGEIVIQTETTSGTVTSRSVDRTFVPTTTEGEQALAAVNATLAAMKDTVNAKGANLAAADLVPFLRPDFMLDGENRTIQAKRIATDFRGLEVTAFELTRIRSIDTVNDVVDAIGRLDLRNSAGRTGRETFEMKFKGDGLNPPTYLLWGTQQIADVENAVQFERRTDSFATGTSTQNSINVDVSAPQGTVTGVQVSGPPSFSTTGLSSGGTRTSDVQATPGGPIETLFSDAFFTNSGPVTLPSVPAQYTFDIVTPGGQVQYTVTVNATAGETISFTTNPNTHSRAAILGQTITVSWSLPQTYALTEVDLRGHVMAGNFSREIDPDQGVIGLTDTSATLTFPTTINPGGAVTDANWNLTFQGPNGERSIVIYVYDQP